MSRDLTLLPLEGQAHKFSSDLISLDRNQDLFEIIKDLAETKGRVVPQINCYKATLISVVCDENRNVSVEEVEGYGTISEDKYYDEPLVSLVASDIWDCLDDYGDLSPKNRAVKAYLCELNSLDEIVLYWN